MAGQGSEVAPTTGRWRRRTGSGAPPPWFGIVFAVMGLAAIGFSIVGADELRRLDEQGVSVQGRVISRSSGTDSDGNRTYSVIYEFVEPATGAAHRRSTSVGRAFYDATVDGAPVTITFLPADPGTSRLGTPPFRNDAAEFVGLGIGLLFALVGAGMAYAGFRASRQAVTGPAMVPVIAGPSGAPAGMTGAALDTSAVERARVEDFTRSPGRAILDSLLPPIGGAGFLLFALFLLGQAGRDPTLILFVLLAGFFAVLLLSGIPAVLRRGLGLRLLSVGPAGIDHRDVGLIRWNDIAEVRVERNIGSGGEGLAAYLRLGIVPRDAALARRLSSGLAWKLIGAFVRFANSAARGRGARSQMTDVADIAPIGVYGYELQQPFEDLVASVRRFAPVVDAAVARTAAAEAQHATLVDPAPEHGPVTQDELRELDSLLGRPSAVTAADLASVIATPAPTAAPPKFVIATPAPTAAPRGDVRPRARTFYRRGTGRDGLGAAIESVASVSGGLSQLWSAAVWAVFVVFPLVFVANGIVLLARGEVVSGLAFFIPLLLSVLAMGQLLGDLARWPLLTGDPDLLRVGPDGVTAKGFGHLPWSAVAEVTADADWLTIRYRPGTALPERFWAAALRDRYVGLLRKILPFGPRVRQSYSLDFALLEADRDEVLDAIATHRVVTED